MLHYMRGSQRDVIEDVGFQENGIMVRNKCVRNNTFENNDICKTTRKLVSVSLLRLSVETYK